MFRFLQKTKHFRIKSIIFFMSNIMLLCIINSCINQQENTDLYKLKLKNKVRYLKTNTYKAIERFGNIEKGERIGKGEYLIFNESGNIIEKTISNSDTTVFIKIIYIYHSFPSKNYRFEIMLDSNGHYVKQYTYIYDQKGNDIELFGDSLSLENISSDYKYDSKGNIIEIKNDNFLNGITTKNMSYKYDNRGNIIETKTYNNNKLDNKTIFNRNNKGNVIEEISYLPNNQSFYSINYEFDNKENINKAHKHYYLAKVDYECKYNYNNGRITTETWYNKNDNQILDIHFYKYNQTGNMISDEGWNCSSFGFCNEFELDNKGIIIKKYNFGYGDKLINKWSYTYDKKENKIQENKYNSIGKLVERINRSYDNRGNVVKEENYNSDKILTYSEINSYDNKKNIIKKTYELWNLDDTFKYVFDKNGNWTKKIIFINQEPHTVIEREIEYY